MGLKDLELASFSKYELDCLLNSIKTYLAKNDGSGKRNLKDLLFMLEKEISNRN
ncbi:hypothetical protein [Salipaludibacillus neizhouensis]|uniref:hypothetical protein n=1 Tax=Salipaludibacillus neizhouensis TaxID=885475 RepID=UPI0016022398|nr:hypothetical protein [Salipaludibacillus neizhouensis]